MATILRMIYEGTSKMRYGKSVTLFIPSVGIDGMNIRRTVTQSQVIKRGFAQRRIGSARMLRMGGREMDVEKIIGRAVNGGARKEMAGQSVRLVQCVIRDWTYDISKFHTPPEAAAIEAAVRGMTDVRVMRWGGYEGAERTTLAVGHADVVADEGELLEVVRDKMALVRIVGAFSGRKVLHRDFLGAVLGCGVSREGVGDLKVLKEGGGAEVIVRTEIGEALMGIDQVGGVKVDVEIIIGKTSDISKTEREMKEVVTTEASLRVDAVGSGGLGVPRSRVTELARNGAVFVNYRAVTGGKCVKEGDVVSVRGVGKVVIGSCTRTRKGRFRIEMKKYV